MIHAIESGQAGMSPMRMKKKNRRTAAQIAKDYVVNYFHNILFYNLVPL